MLADTLHEAITKFCKDNKIQKMKAYELFKLLPEVRKLEIERDKLKKGEKND